MLTNPLIKWCKSNSRFLFPPTFEVLLFSLLVQCFTQSSVNLIQNFEELKNIEKITQNLRNLDPMCSGIVPKELDKYMSRSNSLGRNLSAHHLRKSQLIRFLEGELRNETHYICFPFPLLFLNFLKIVQTGSNGSWSALSCSSDTQPRHPSNKAPAMREPGGSEGARSRKREPVESPVCGGQPQATALDTSSIWWTGST